MNEIIDRLLTEAGVQIIIPAVLAIFGNFIAYMKLVGVLRGQTKDLRKRNEKLIEENKKDSRSWMLDLWQKISEENLKDNESLKEEIKRKEEIIARLDEENRILKNEGIKEREKFSQVEIQNMSLRFYIEIILSFIGNEEFLKQKILSDPTFRKLMREKDIDKILGEVQAIKKISKPRRSFDWLKRTNLFYLFLSLDLIHFGKLLLSESKRNL